MKAYPIKDYRNEDDYQNCRGLTAWRWQFLRRDPEYQAFHELHKDDPKPPYCGAFGIRALHDPRHDQAFAAFTDGGNIVGLPTFDSVEKWKKVPGYSPERGLFMVLETLTELQARGATLVAIDRALPLEPQLDAIREVVEMRNEADSQNPVLQKLRTGEWPQYMRILDGLAVGASHDVIASVLYPTTDNTYPDFAGRKRVKAAARRATYLCRTFGRRAFKPEN